jgi:hypothetical protein
MTVSQPTSQGTVAKPGFDEEVIMSDACGVQPDPDRLRLLRNVFDPAPLREVSEAVCVATQDEHQIHVEKLGDAWRWSLTHPGSGYPLLRITARFLGVDYHRISVGFRTVKKGVCVLSDDPSQVTVPEAWVVLKFDGPTPADEVEEQIVGRLGTPR